MPLALVVGLLIVAVSAAIRGNDRDTGREPDNQVPPDQTATAEASPTTGEQQTPTSPPPTPPSDLASTGTFTVAPDSGATFGQPPFRTFAVAVEDGLGLQPGELALFVDSTLADPRSWIGDTVTGFERIVDMDAADFTLVVASPDTVDALCAPLQTLGTLSCGNNGWIALNVLRWTGATEDWPSDLETYRRYLINHEVGHYVLGPDHDECAEAGALAPIMMQQSISLDGCVPNGWVFPEDS